MQKNTLRYFLLTLLPALTSGAHCLGAEGKANLESLLAQARKLQNVWSDGTPAVKMRTDIKILYAGGKTAPGRYLVTWISPSRWRDELEFSDYKRVRVHDSKGFWQQSTLGYAPEIIVELDSILDFIPVLKIQPKEALGEVKTRNKDGVQQECAEVKRPVGTERVLCFDEASGGLLSVDYPRSANQDPPEISRVEYSGLNKLGDKLIPYQVHAFRDRTLSVIAEVKEVTPITEDDHGLFAPPTNAEFWPNCDDLQSSELIKSVQPTYPPGARSNHEEGTVMFYGVIEADGTLSHLRVIQGATPSLDSAAADAVRQWRYKPAMCGATPIRIQYWVRVYFRLQIHKSGPAW
jgi:TonB family protein